MLMAQKKKKTFPGWSLDDDQERLKRFRRAHRRNRFLLFHRFMFWGWVVIFLVALVEHLLNPGVPTVYVRWYEPEMAMLMMIAMLAAHTIWANIGRSEDSARLDLMRASQSNESDISQFQQKQKILYRVTHRIHLRQRLLTLHGFFLANFAIVSLFTLDNRSTGQQDSIILTLMWMGIFAMHFFYNRFRERQDDELLSVMHTSEESPVKRKRHDEKAYGMRLGDDGELVHGDFSESELTDEEIAYYEQMQHNQRR